MKAYLFSMKQAFKSSPFWICFYIVICILPVAALEGLMITSQKNMLDGAVLFSSGNKTLNAFIVLVVLFFVFNVLCAVLRNVAKPFIWAKIEMDIKVRTNIVINKKFLKLKYALYEQDKTKDILEKANHSPGYIIDALNNTVNIVLDVLGSISILMVLWYIQWQFSLVVAACGVFDSIIVYFRSVMRKNAFGQNGRIRRELNSYKKMWNEGVVPSQAELRTFGTTDKMVDYTYNNFLRCNKQTTKIMRTSQLLSLSIRPMFLIVNAMIVIFVLVHGIKGDLSWSVGEVTVALTSFSAVMFKFSAISRSFTEMLVESQATDYFYKFSKLEEEKEGTINNLPKDRTIEIKNVCFTYPGTKEEILRNVSFKINPAEHIAFVGRNGSGKSTLIKLILGLYEPTSGEITVGGSKITDYTRAARQKLFGVQYQDFYNYPLPIREVVALGNLDILNDDKKINQALKSAGILGAIKEKGATLNTQNSLAYTTNGVEFSGGQKQRLSLATTLAFNHNHLILDEPTAALDAVAENKMYEVFMSGIKNKGSLIVSHRLASARISDRILVFENGRIVQDGTHDKLMKKRNGLYRKMFMAQAGLYKGGETDEN